MLACNMKQSLSIINYRPVCNALRSAVSLLLASEQANNVGRSLINEKDTAHFAIYTCYFILST
jgi:hypothetical protein